MYAPRTKPRTIIKHMKPIKLQSFNVLVVDDEPLIRTLVSNVLGHLGFTSITVVNNGRKALEAIGKDIFDFIITDWRMEDLDGIEIVRHIRSSSDTRIKRMPIIMLTGNTEASYVKTAISAGVNGYLIKPFSAEQLVKRIRSIIETPRNFVISKSYTGPDRRHMNLPAPNGIERRKKKDKNNALRRQA